MRIGGLDRFFQVNVNTLATIPLKGILVLHLAAQKCFKQITCPVPESSPDLTRVMKQMNAPL
jgi:hypothetical protein